MALISYIHLVRFPDGTAIMDLPGLFADLDDPARRASYWWLAVMLASTLIPTVLHAMVGVFTLLLHYPAGLRRWVVAKLESGGNGAEIDGWWGSAAYCAMLTLSVWVPIWVLSWLLGLDHGAALRWMIAGFEWYAASIGAI